MDIKDMWVKVGGTRGIFSGNDHARLAYLIFRRWGCNMEAACVAWQRLFENNCAPHEFKQLVDAGERLQ